MTGTFCSAFFLTLFDIWFIILFLASLDFIYLSSPTLPSISLGYECSIIMASHSIQVVSFCPSTSCIFIILQINVEDCFNCLRFSALIFLNWALLFPISSVGRKISFRSCFYYGQRLILDYNVLTCRIFFISVVQIFVSTMASKHLRLKILARKSTLLSLLAWMSKDNLHCWNIECLICYLSRFYSHLIVLHFFYYLLYRHTPFVAKHASI